MAESSSFESLSPGVQKWIYRQGWSGLREIQEVAVPVVLAAAEDELHMVSVQLLEMGSILQALLSMH